MVKKVSLYNIVEALKFDLFHVLCAIDVIILGKEVVYYDML